MISFTGYRTFTMSAGYAPRGYETSPRGAEVQRRLQPLVAQALNQRGYVEATTERPDFVVLIGSGRRVVSQNQSADNIGSPSWLPDDENLDFVEGAVVIDAFDGKTAAQIWHGASQARIDPDHIDDALLQKTVAQLISGFPRAAHEVH